MYANRGQMITPSFRFLAAICEFEWLDSLSRHKDRKIEHNKQSRHHNFNINIPTLVSRDFQPGLDIDNHRLLTMGLVPGNTSEVKKGN